MDIHKHIQKDMADRGYDHYDSDVFDVIFDGTGDDPFYKTIPYEKDGFYYLASNETKTLLMTIDAENRFYTCYTEFEKVFWMRYFTGLIQIRLYHVKLIFPAVVSFIRVIGKNK